MAVGTGIGFDLDALAKALEKADKSLDRLLTKNKKFGEEMIQTFLGIGAKGVEPFLAKLKEQKAALEMLANVKMDGASAALKQLTRDAKNALDQTNALINSFGQLAYASENRGAKNASMQYAKEYEDKTRFYERWINETYLKEQERTQQEAQQANERARNSSAAYQQELREKERFYLDWINKTFEADERRRKKEEEEEKKKNERIAAEQARLDSESRKRRYHAYTTSYEGAIRTSDKAKTLAQEIQAVKNLEAARAKLVKTDADYDAKLRDINNRIAEHSRNIDQATGRAKKLEQQHQRNANQMTALQSLAGSVGRALAGMFGVQAIKGYVNKLIQVRGEFELQHKSLQVLIGDIDKANELWDKTVALAVKSPFRVKDLVTYTKQLAAYRVEADKLYDTNKMLADVSAGLGVDMNRLILAFGQVKAANFLRGTELRQFSEAGVNMLEELSKRYTELEGRMVSVGEVFERVSKRMVSFSDVEAVFKTITSEGGSFYRMQEKQAETLRGMVMNLKDSIDLMFNEIGESNEGLLKGAIERVRDLVDNWQKFVTILQEVGVAFVAMKLPVVVKMLGALGTSAYFTAANITKAGLSTAIFGKGIQRLTVGIGALTKALLHNPLFVGGAIAASLLLVVHRFMRHNKEVAELNKKYDELSVRESNRLKKLDDLAEKAKTYNKSIEESEETLSKSAKGTEEYANAEKKLAEARSSNQQLLDEIKKDYPQIYDAIKKNTDGTLDLNAAIEAQNQLLVANIALNEQAKGGMFFDDVATNAKEATVALVNQYNAFIAFQNAVTSKKTNLIGLREMGEISETQFETLTNYLNQLSSVQNASEVNTILGAMAAELRGNSDAFNAIIKPIENAKNALAGFGIEAAASWENLKGNLDRMYPSLMHFVNTAKQFTPDKWQETAAQNISASLSAFGIVDENLLAKVREYIESMEGIGELTWEIPKPEYSENDLKDWRKVIWDAIKEVNKSLGDDLGQNKVVISLQDMIELDKETIFKNLSEQVSTAAKNIDDTIAAGLIPTQERFSQAQLEAAEASKPLIKSLSDLLAIVEKSNDGSKDLVMEKLRNRINLIKEMNKEYERLRKTFSEEESLEKVRKAYEDTAKKLELDASTMDFTDAGTIKSLEDLLGKPEYAANEYVLELQKALDNFKVELGITTKQEDDERLKNDIQKLFDQYDLTLELKKLNIPPELAKSLFDVDYLDLDGLKKAVQAQESKFVGTDMEQDYEDFLKKINELSRKAQEDEAKEFINFLKKNLDEIKLVQDKGAHNIALADRLFGEGKITAEQYTLSVRQIVEDTNKEVAKINLEKFKDSSTYIKAMGNLAAYSRKELEGMISALQEQVGTNAGNMGADEIQAYYEALERLVDQYDKLESPFQKGEINDLIEYLGLQKQLNQEKEKEVALEQRKTDLNVRLELLQAKLASQQASGDTQGANVTQGLIKDTVNELKEVDGQLISVTSNISVISEKVANLGDGMVKSLVVAQKVVNEIANIAEASTKMFDDIKSAADALGADTESGGWAKAGYAMEMVGGVSSELTSGLANLASGNFAGALANVVGIVTKLISGFAKIHDQNYQDIIEAQAKEVERLGKAYEKLEKATEDAYSIEQLQQANKELERNVELQMQALRAMIAAERAKKNTDEEQIAAWNEELEALTQQWEDLKQSLVEGVGGVSDYRSQTRAFVDSWVSAFKETGDGLSGLQKDFREFFDNIIAEQAALRVTEKFLAPFYDSLNTSLEDLKLTEEESKNLREEADKIMPELSKALELIWNQLGGSRGEADGGSLSALQKGIQGITEDTAQIIEAYLNSIRGYVSEQVTHTKNIYRILNDAVHSDAAAIRVRMV